MNGRDDGADVFSLYIELPDLSCGARVELVRTNRKPKEDVTMANDPDTLAVVVSILSCASLSF